MGVWAVRQYARDVLEKNGKNGGLVRLGLQGPVAGSDSSGQRNRKRSGASDSKCLPTLAREIIMQVRKEEEESAYLRHWLCVRGQTLAGPSRGKDGGLLLLLLLL
jgi:hypothetical protein